MNKSTQHIELKNRGADSFINQANSFAQATKTNRLFRQTMSDEELDHANRFLDEFEKSMQIIKLTETL